MRFVRPVRITNAKKRTARARKLSILWAFTVFQVQPYFTFCCEMSVSLPTVRNVLAPHDFLTPRYQIKFNKLLERYRLWPSVWLFITRNFTSRGDFFTSFWPQPKPKPKYPNPNPITNPDPNSNPNPKSAVAITCLKIKGRETNCLEMNCPVPLWPRIHVKIFD